MLKYAHVLSVIFLTLGRAFSVAVENRLYSFPRINLSHAWLFNSAVLAMSGEKDFSENGNISHIPNETELPPLGNDNAAEAQEPGLHPVEAELPLPENHDAEAELHEPQLLPVDAELPPIENIDRREPEELEYNFNPVGRLLEVQELNLNPVETESKDSGHDSPLQGAVGYQRDLENDSVLEGAGSGVVDCDCGAVHFTPEERMRIKAEKEDLFRKFFSKEYEIDPMAPILGRRRHPARTQRVRQRHVSEDSKLSDPNPLGCLQDEGTSSGAILNQAGAIIGKNIPKEEIPEYKRFGTEFGQSLPLLPRPEGSERSISSIETARIAEVYGGTFSRPPSDRGLSPGSSFPSFSRPPTAASSDLKISPPLDSELPEMDKQSSTLEGKVTREQPARQRRFGVTTRPVALRSKSALAGLSSYPSESDAAESQQRKISKDMSVCSEPLPQRKISKDSSIGYSEQSLEDEINYPELAHSLENDSCMPMPDIDPAVIESLEENLDSLTLSDNQSSAAVQNVGIDQETEQNEATEQDAAGSSQAQSD